MGVCAAHASVGAILPGMTRKGDAPFVPLFNGKDLSGWQAGANASTFSVQDGAIVTHGPGAQDWAGTVALQAHDPGRALIKAIRPQIRADGHG